MTEVYQKISLNDLKILLKQEVKEITLEDIYHFILMKNKNICLESIKKSIESLFWMLWFEDSPH